MRFVVPILAMGLILAMSSSVGAFAEAEGRYIRFNFIITVPYCASVHSVY